jgi:hypothetical protein
MVVTYVGVLSSLVLSDIKEKNQTNQSQPCWFVKEKKQSEPDMLVRVKANMAQSPSEESGLRKVFGPWGKCGDKRNGRGRGFKW